MKFLHRANPLKSRRLKEIPAFDDRMIMKIVTLVLFLLSSPLFARSPAVEPVSGISIEEYREVEPSKAAGYNFTREEPPYEQSGKNAQLTPTTAFFLIVASALPFVVWFGIMRALPDATPTTPQQSQTPTLSIINGEGGKSDEEDEHDSLPKAS